MKVRKVLIMSALPINTPKLKVVKEMEEIEKVFESTKYRKNFEVIKKNKIDKEDLIEYVQKLKPEIVHFSGHGAGKQGIVLENKNEYSEVFPTESLEKLFHLVQNHTSCIVLNACYSTKQAQKLSTLGLFVIGMNKAIADTTAMKFSLVFYQSLGNGSAVKTAFRYAEIALSKEGIIPELWYNGEKVIEFEPEEKKKNNRPFLWAMPIIILIGSFMFFFKNWGQNASIKGLEIVDVVVRGQSDKTDTFDIKCVNNSDNPILLNAINFRLKKSWELVKPIYQGGHGYLEPSKNYDVFIPFEKTESLVSQNISQLLSPKEADRFLVVVTTGDTNFVSLFNIELVSGENSIKSKDLVHFFFGSYGLANSRNYKKCQEALVSGMNISSINEFGVTEKKVIEEVMSKHEQNLKHLTEIDKIEAIKTKKYISISKYIKGK